MATMAIEPKIKAAMESIGNIGLGERANNSQFYEIVGILEKFPGIGTPYKNGMRKYGGVFNTPLQLLVQQHNDPFCNFYIQLKYDEDNL